MNKYKINYTYSQEDINNIFIKALTKELKKYLYKNKQEVDKID